MESVVSNIRSSSNKGHNGIYKGRTVLVTGHTGFKGAWLSIWLNGLGAKVIGFSLDKYDNDFVFRNSRLKKSIADERGDIRDLKRLREVFQKHRPEIVFHLAAQPLVRDSYNVPAETFDTNIMGTVNVLECIRLSDSVRAGVMITTDKCYKNKEDKCKEKGKGYTESDELWGYDPYSASKACAEIAIDSYRNSFFNNADSGNGKPAKLVASARAGNVIGGGDFAKDRLIPDCIKALKEKKPIIIRNPNHTRPWQHVLEPLNGYLMLGQRLLEGKKEFAGPWNFGPDRESIINVSNVADIIVKQWGEGKWVDSGNKNEKMHETTMLCLDNSKAKKLLKWSPKLSITESLKKTVEWYRRSEKEDAHDLCLEQIREYSCI